MSAYKAQIPIHKAKLFFQTYAIYLKILETSLANLRYKRNLPASKADLDIALADMTSLSGTIRPLILEFRGVDSLNWKSDLGNTFDAINFASVDHNVVDRHDCVRHLRSIVTSIASELEYLPNDQIIEFNLFPEQIRMQDANRQNTITVNGNNVVIAVDSENIKQTIKTNIEKGNIQSLKQGLEDLGIDKSNIQELIDILNADPNNPEKNKDGINHWLANMCSLAASKAWSFGSKVGISFAVKALNELISHYLGSSVLLNS